MSTPPSNCDPSFTAGSVTLALDAPQEPISTQPLPQNFRSMQGLPVSGNTASGSAQYSLSQLQAMINQNKVTTPLIVVDLRQESHGFLELTQPLNGETEIAVGWFAERDWINVAKDLPSINLDESTRLIDATHTSNLLVYKILTKATTEDGICTAEPHIVQPKGVYRNEQAAASSVANVGYLRLPSTDHCRPRDTEVDQFVAFEKGLAPNTWLHFHCRAGDGRTTTFLAMHDIIHNAPGDSLETILKRQGPSPGIGGIDLMNQPKDPEVFDFPFSAERVFFVQMFYNYVSEAKPGGFELQWSNWLGNWASQP